MKDVPGMDEIRAIHSAHPKVGFAEFSSTNCMRGEGAITSKNRQEGITRTAGAVSGYETWSESHG